MSDAPLLDLQRHALFLDFDGTLAAFRDRPSEVELDPAVRDDIGVLARRLGGALAVVSGRRVEDLDRFLEPLRLPLAGIHGFEMRADPDGAVTRKAGPDRLDGARAALAQGVRRNEGLRLEDKGLALVMHYRGRPDLAETALEMMRAAARDDPGLTVVPGHAITEIRPNGVDKGAAVIELLEADPFRGRLPVYVGDDTTDEDAMRVAEARGGFAIKVGPGETVASQRLADIEAVHRWLHRSLDAR